MEYPGGVVLDTPSISQQIFLPNIAGQGEAMGCGYRTDTHPPSPSGAPSHGDLKGGIS